MCDALREEIDALREQVNELQGTVEAQQETIEKQAERIDELEERPALEYRGDKQEPDDLIIDNYPIGAKVANSMTEVDVENALDEHECENSGVDELQEANENDVDLLPIQELARLPESMAQEQLSANDLRARFLWRDFEEYSQRTPQGRVINSTTMRRVLRAAEPIVDDGTETKIESKTVGRVMQRIAKYTRGSATVSRSDSGERRLHVPNDWRSAADDTADSVVSEGRG